MHRYTIEVNGRTYSLDLRELSPDRFEVACEDRAFDVLLVDETDLPDAEAPLSREAALAEVPRAAGLVGAGKGAEASAKVAQADKALTAPMPGVILSVLARPGARVKRGDTLATLEAMKMESPLKAPRDTVIGEVLVTDGQAVAYGDTLITFAE